MTNRYAVSFINLYSNEMTIEIVSANNEREALLSHSAIYDGVEYDEGLSIGETVEEIQQICFDADMMMAVTQITD